MKIYIFMLSLFKNSGKIRVKILIMSSGFYWVSVRNIEDRAKETFLFALNLSVFWEIYVYIYTCMHSMAFPGGSEVKNPPANAGDSGDLGSIPGLGRSSGEGHGNPLWYSCLENPMDKEDPGRLYSP